MRRVPQRLVVCSAVVLLVGTGSAAPMTQDVFGLEFTLYQNHTVTDTHMTITPDEPLDVPRSKTGPYRFTARDSDGEVLYSLDVNFRFVRVAHPQGPTITESIPVTVRVPYDHRATAIELSHKGEVIHTFETAADLCPPPFDEKRYHDYCNSVDPGVIDTLASDPLKPAGAVLGILLLAGLAVYGYRRHQSRNQQQTSGGGRNNRRIQNSRNRKRHHER